MTHARPLAAALATAALTLALTACAGDDAGHAGHAGHATAEQTAPNGDVFNDADVDFATAMIPHHAQALSMVDLTRGRRLSPEVQRLTEQIQAAQAPEIEQMVDWLDGWGEPVPETMRDHANADSGSHGMSDMHADMPGMMSADEMADLEAASDAEFEHMWLEMMIRHHEGAIEMAEAEQADGVYAPAVDLAGSISTSQQAEIDTMEQLLGP